MAADVGDAPLFDRYWDVTDPRFVDLLPTTWAELAEKGLTERRRVMGYHAYHLTERGWLTGLDLNGTFSDPAFREKAVALVAFLKGQVKGRNAPTDAFIHPSHLPLELPFGFVLNALKSGLLQHMFPDKRMNARWDASKNIRVPITFGIPLD
jgi:hypothetical protein